MSRDNIDSMRVPNVPSGDCPGLEAFGIQPASLESVMTPWLQGRTGVARFEPLRASAHRR